MSEKLTTIKLCGELGKKFGKTHKFAVASVAEAVKAMTVILP
jgi:predicted phage tail protein